MTEQETKQTKRKKRRRRRKSSTNNVNVEEPATKKPRLNSQEEDPASQLCTKAQVELTSNSKGIINDTRVLEISGQESFHLGSHFDTQTVSDRVKETTVSSLLYTNGNTRSHSAKKYTITEKDLIYLAQIKENNINEDKRMSGRPVITFSISDNNLTHLELIQSKENDEINEYFISKEQIDNLKGNGQVENFRSEDSVNEIIPENIKTENDSSIQIGNNEVNEVNGGIENQTGCVENFEEHDQIIQNRYIENSDEHEDSINNGHFEISEKDNNLPKQFLRHTNSKHLRPGLEKYNHLFFSL